MSHYADRIWGRTWLSATVSFMLAVLGQGCGESDAIHASLLETDSRTEESLTPFDQTWWRCSVSEEETWISAHTQVYLWIPEQVDDTFDVYVMHEDGTLVLGGTTIPPDTWGMATGTWIPGRSQLLVTASFAGHSFQFDADASNNALEGWFTLDETYAFFQRCMLQP